MTLENDSWPEKNQRRPSGLQLASGQKGAVSQKIMVPESLFTLFNAPNFLRGLIEHSSVNPLGGTINQALSSEQFPGQAPDLCLVGRQPISCGHKSQGPGWQGGF